MSTIFWLREDYILAREAKGEPSVDSVGPGLEMAVRQDDQPTYDEVDEATLNWDLTCGEWFVHYEQDENGGPVPGTIVGHCTDGGFDVPFG